MRIEFFDRPVGLMDKASASGAGDSRFESWAGQIALRRMQLRGLEPAQGNAIGLASISLDRPPPPPPRNLPRGAGVTPTQGGTVRRGYANLVSPRVEQMIASDDPFAGGVLHCAHRGPTLVTRVRAQYPNEPGNGVIRKNLLK